MELELIDDHYCFVCGGENPTGLKIEWKTEGDATEAEFLPERVHQGWKGLVHGGLLATILDEAMTRLAWQRHGGAVTAEITVRYAKPARVGEKLFVRGQLGAPAGRLIPATAEIRTEAGDLVASSTGKAVLPRTKVP